MKKLFLLALVFIVTPTGARADFFISAASSCSGSNTYSYQIGSSVSYPDLRVSVGESVSYPDIRIRTVTDPTRADLIFVDDSALDYSSRSQVDMRVCKRTSYADKRIQVGNSVSYPDIRVRVGNSVSYPDYRLYYDSEKFSLEEAAGLFPAIWEFNKE